MYRFNLLKPTMRQSLSVSHLETEVCDTKFKILSKSFLPHPGLKVQKYFFHLQWRPWSHLRGGVEIHGHERPLFTSFLHLTLLLVPSLPISSCLELSQLKLALLSLMFMPTVSASCTKRLMSLSSRNCHMMAHNHRTNLTRSILSGRERFFLFRIRQGIGTLPCTVSHKEDGSTAGRITEIQSNPMRSLSQYLFGSFYINSRRGQWIRPKNFCLCIVQTDATCLFLKASLCRKAIA